MRKNIRNTISVLCFYEKSYAIDPIIKTSQIYKINWTAFVILNCCYFACSLINHPIPEVNRVFSLFNSLCITTFYTSTSTIALISLFCSSRIYFYICIKYNNNQNQKFNMFAIKTMLGLGNSHQKILAEHFSKISIDNSQPLPLIYHLPQSCALNSQAKQIFRQLVFELQSASCLSKIFKMLTVLIKSLRQSEYKIQYIQVLGQMQIPDMLKVDRKDNQWAYQIVIAIKSYLLRLPSIAHLLRNALSPTFQVPSNKDNCLDNLFRLINVFSLLFPNINNGINTIGRYYMKTYLFMSEFYAVVKEEILLGYSYIQKIVKIFLQGYKDCSLRSLRCFMVVTPEIQLFCDKAEQFILNKYFKGKNMRQNTRNNVFFG